MKKSAAIFLLFAMLLLSACGGGTDSNAGKTQIDVKGVFLLEPSDQLNLSTEGLDTVQRYLFAVYDVDNSGNDSNVEVSGFSDAVEVTLNDTNTYEQCSGSTLIRNFIDNSGYTTPGECGTLWGGSEPVRMISAFAVNQNDMKDGCTAKLNFNLSLNAQLRYTAEIAGTDIQTIAWPDGVFAVEDDPDAWQLVHSVKIRAQICKNSLEAASRAEQNRDTDTRDLNLTICKSVLEDNLWGVSCVADNSVTTELPVFSLATIQECEPELAGQVSTVRDAVETMRSELAKSSPDYDAVNSAQRTAYSTLNAMLG